MQLYKGLFIVSARPRSSPCSIALRSIRDTYESSTVGRDNLTSIFQSFLGYEFAPTLACRTYLTATVWERTCYHRWTTSFRLKNLPVRPDFPSLSYLWRLISFLTCIFHLILFPDQTLAIWYFSVAAAKRSAGKVAASAATSHARTSSLSRAASSSALVERKAPTRQSTTSTTRSPLSRTSTTSTASRIATISPAIVSPGSQTSRVRASTNGPAIASPAVPLKRAGTLTPSAKRPGPVASSEKKTVAFHTGPSSPIASVVSKSPRPVLTTRSSPQGSTAPISARSSLSPRPPSPGSVPKSSQLRAGPVSAVAAAGSVQNGDTLPPLFTGSPNGQPSTSPRLPLLSELHQSHRTSPTLQPHAEPSLQIAISHDPLQDSDDSVFSCFDERFTWVCDELGMAYQTITPRCPLTVQM